MTDEQLEKAGKIKHKIFYLPKLDVKRDGTSSINTREAYKILRLMFPNSQNAISGSSSCDTFICFTVEDTLNINAIIDAKRKQLEDEFAAL